ncbi:hypothetical protein KSF78_0001816 [Schistosoma japonicum]|uniref:Uncharacterized protein n=1 Tax=Schistosoma japonicum TaxID=6182 RepID=C1L5M1_SCHJA|nr:hypothetical protein KSF78_0001816 [Schistosoma japonicum]KAH8854845.1 hypothetical protein KSF78_0001816 [Schistosoma japonicum]CAX69999.1 hypothetical protein [Schistosoma japonicum]
MKFIVAISLLVLMTLIYTEASPENLRFQLQKTLMDTGEKFKTLSLRLLTRCRNRVREYFKQDDLGEKIAEVLLIFLQRLNRRLEKYLSRPE